MLKHSRLSSLSSESRVERFLKNRKVKWFSIIITIIFLIFFYMYVMIGSEVEISNTVTDKPLESVVADAKKYFESINEQRDVFDKGEVDDQRDKLKEIRNSEKKDTDVVNNHLSNDVSKFDSNINIFVPNPIEVYALQTVGACHLHTPCKPCPSETSEGCFYSDHHAAFECYIQTTDSVDDKSGKSSDKIVRYVSCGYEATSPQFTFTIFFLLSTVIALVSAYVFIQRFELMFCKVT